MSTTAPESRHRLPSVDAMAFAVAMVVALLRQAKEEE